MKLHLTYKLQHAFNGNNDRRHTSGAM